MPQLSRSSGLSALAVAAMITLGGCSATVGASPSASPTGEAGIEVGQELLDVVVTLPASLFTGTTEEQILASAEEAGYRAEVAADGSVTYTIPRAIYQGLLSDMSVSIDDSIDETLATQPSITEITHDTSFTTFRMTVDRAAFEGSISAAFVALGLGIQGMFYQSFNDVAEADRRVVITYVDGATGEEFGSYVLPDALEQ